MPWRNIGGVEVEPHVFLTSALDAGYWQVAVGAVVCLVDTLFRPMRQLLKAIQKDKSGSKKWLKGGRHKRSRLLGKGRSISDLETSIRSFLTWQLGYELLASRSGYMNCVDQLMFVPYCTLKIIIYVLYSVVDSSETFNPFKAECLRNVPRALTLRNSTFCLQSAFLGFLWTRRTNSDCFLIH
jgi:hypothetical protein